MTVSGFHLNIVIEIGPGRNVDFTTPLGELEADAWKFAGSWSIPGGRARLCKGFQGFRSLFGARHAFLEGFLCRL